MIELMVAMIVLVIAFGLITFLYTRAARIRRIVVVNSEIQQALSRMTDILTYGESNSWGLIDATSIETGLDASTLSETTILVARKGSTPMVAAILTDNTTSESTLQISWDGGDFISIDPKGVIRLLVDDTSHQTKFEYYNSAGNKLNIPLSADDCKTATFVKITLWAKSTDPAYRKAPPVPFVTGVRLKNKPSL